MQTKKQNHLHRQKAYSFDVSSVKNQFSMLHIIRLPILKIKPCNLRRRERLPFKRIYLPTVNKLEFRAFEKSRKATNLSCERELINKSSDSFVFLRILFTKENTSFS